MKKNKWLLMLAAITLLATCLFAGLAVAADAGTGDAWTDADVVAWPVGWNTDHLPDESDAVFNAVMSYDEYVRQSTYNPPFIRDGAIYDVAPWNYYEGEINLIYGDPVLSRNNKGNIETIGWQIWNNGVPVDKSIIDDLYFRVSSSDRRIVAIGNANTAVTGYIRGNLMNSLKLVFEQHDEMLDYLYGDGVLADIFNKPGTAKIKIEAYYKEGNKYILCANPFTFTVNIKPVLWKSIRYVPNSAFVYAEGDHYVIYLEQLQQFATRTDVGWEFNVNMLGDWVIKPNNVTYRKIKFDVDDTNVVNIWARTNTMVIKRTGTFELTASDMDGYSNISKTIKFVVKDEMGTPFPISNVKFTTREFTRTVGEYINLNKYVDLIRTDVLGLLANFRPGYVFTQHLMAGDGMHIPNTEGTLPRTATSKEQPNVYTWWLDDGNPGFSIRLGYTEVDSANERFYIRWKSSDSNVARVVNAKDVLIDTSIPSAWWIPVLDGSWNDFYTGSNSASGGKRLAWYSKADKMFIFPAQGYVRAMNPGTATITVEVRNYGDNKIVYSATTKIVVKAEEDPFGDDEPENVLVTKISAKNVKLSVGEKKELAFTVKPANATNQKVTFSSSDKKIVKINSKGVMTARKAGTAYITITAKDGSGVSKTIKVTVK